MHRKFVCSVLYAMLALALASTPAVGQVTTANIVGTVTDSSGAVMPGASISISNVATGAVRTLTAGSTGDYAFDLVPAGHYKVRVEMKGFKSYEVPDLAVGAGDRARIDAQLQAGSITESIEVQATPPALQTDSSTVQDTVTEQAVQDLPLNGRNLIGLVQATAGVNAGSPGSISSGNRPDDRRPTSSFSANGQSDQLNNQMVDGLDNNEREQGFGGIRPSIDGIAEVRVMTNDYTAEAGRTAGAIVNIITKSGSNEVHGSVYEYFRNDVFDARDFFAMVKPEYRQNQFGGSIGGPIAKNRTFFFADVEESRVIQGQTETSTVPTLYQEQHPGDFSDIGGPVVPSFLLNPVSLNLFKLYPAPNKPGFINNFVYSPNKTQYSTTVDARLDHRFNDRDSIFARYSYNPVSTFVPGAFPDATSNGVTVNPSGDAFAGPSKTTAQSVMLDYVHIFRPNLLMELKAGYTRINIATYPLNYGSNASQKFGIQNSNISPDSSGLANMWFLAGDYSGIGNGLFIPIFDTNNTFQYNGAVTWNRGAHNIKMGAALIRRQLNYFQDSFTPQGGFIFEPIPPLGNSMANFLAGIALFTERGNLLVHPGYRTWEPSAYMQDDWRVNRWLTLNLGLRWEVYTPMTEAHNNYSNFDVSTLKVELAGQSTSSTLGVKTDYRDFSPRIGFAATAARGLVIRGGFGISFYPGDIQGTIQNVNPPYSYSCFPCFGATYPSLILPSATSTAVPAGTLSVKPSNFRPAYLEQFNLFVQKEVKNTVVSVGAIGNLGRHLLYQLPLDQPAPPGANQPAPSLIYASQLPAVTSIVEFANAATSNYYGAQASVVRRLSKGITLNLNYTLAHGLSSGSIDSTQSGGTGLVSNNIRYDYGNSDLDVRQRMNIAANYELPFGKGLKGLPAQMLQGWQLNTITFWQTGLPITVTSAAPMINVPGITADRPNQTGPATLANPGIGKWFNTAVFSPQIKGTAGSEGRNPVYGPHQRSVNLSLLKTFSLTERWHLQFRAECFNLANMADFNTPNGSFGSPGFGTISSTDAPPRQFQFALKLLF